MDEAFWALLSSHANLSAHPGTVCTQTKRCSTIQNLLGSIHKSLAANHKLLLQCLVAVGQNDLFSHMALWCHKNLF